VRWELPEPLDRGDAIAQVDSIALNCRVLDLTLRVVMRACRASNDYQMSIWDALIWVAAKVNEVPCILTEDAEHGRLLDGVTYLNPFHDEFDAAELGRI
jgi:predicted nucleic acid-binding protein